MQVDVTATVEAEAAAGVAAAAKAACCDAADVASTAQMGVVGAVRVAVRGLKCDGACFVSAVGCVIIFLSLTIFAHRVDAAQQQ